MEQYLNLVWKNYTATLSRNDDDESFSTDSDESSDTFANNDLHYKIPFWIGVIVISLLCLSALIAVIRFCFHTLCASHHETEKVALVSPRSPCLTSAANTIQRQRRQLPNNFSHHLSDENEKISSPTKFHEELKDHRSDICIVPIVRQQSRPNFTPTHSLKRQEHILTDTDSIDHHHHHRFSSNQTPRSRAPVDFRKKIHGIYVLPVSPALSSSSSTTNTDEIIKNSSNTMPIRSLRYLSSTNNVHNDSSCRGIKNDCFADSPQPKDRTLPRSHAGTLKRVQPPTEPPPLPPTIAQIHFNDIRSSNILTKDKSSFPHQTVTMDLDPDTIALRFTSQKIYGAIEENQLKKAPPPPVPCRSQKPTVLPIGFEGLSSTHSNDILGFRVMMESSPQDDSSEHTWPKPPESMTTSEISGPPQPLPFSIPYDRLHHDHLIPTVLMRQNSTTNFFQHHRFGDHTMLTESET